MDDEDILPNHLFVSLRHEFQATRVIGHRLSPTKIKVKVDVSTLDDDSDDYSTKMEIALAKIEHWFNKVVSDSVIFDGNNDWAVDSFIEGDQPRTSNMVILTPEPPTDALLCELLLCKIKALAGGTFEFHSAEVESTDSRGLSFMFVGGSPGESFPSNEEWLTERNYFSKPWWHRDDASTLDVLPDEEDDINTPPQWAYSLGFIAEELAAPSSSIPSNVVVRPEFRPKVIDGGKQE
jgi:hypothetical protein